ncbi:MAG: general secretion pathway protein E [Kiritimatiellia bacterium]|jgi:general secretion pathway protein E
MAIRRGLLAVEAEPSAVQAGAGVARVLQLARAEGSVRAAWQQHRDVSALEVARALSDLSGLPFIEDVDINLIEPAVIRPVPLSMAREHGFVPMYVSDGYLLVGIGELSTLPHLDDLRVLMGHPVRPVLMPVDALDKAINQAWDKAAQSAHAVLAESGDADDDDDDLFLDADLLDDPNEAPIIRFVNALLTQAIKERASDIHIEPFEKELLVRFRVDGVLHNTIQPPYKYKDSIVARIKIMAGLNIAEKRLPQDGRIRRRMGGREIDLRVSTVPVRHGERVVMRILEKGEVFALGNIGMHPTILEDWRERIHKPNGILLVCGPTGSGKSSTLFSSLAEINRPDLNILTIEDPVEYELKGLGQVQVNSKINLTFASALRAFLRQDPDVILVGEIRDHETASNAVQASLTGHLVMSTIHTNDAAGAFTRLIDMGIEPFLVSDQLLGVLGQRLVRRLCDHCKTSTPASDVELAELGMTRHQIAERELWHAVGCDECNNLGYRGRCGIFEFLAATDAIKAAVAKGGNSVAIKDVAKADGMLTLRDDGVRKAMLGVTSIEEVLRITRENES